MPTLPLPWPPALAGDLPGCGPGCRRGGQCSRWCGLGSQHPAAGSGGGGRGRGPGAACSQHHAPWTGSSAGSAAAAEPDTPTAHRVSINT